MSVTHQGEVTFHEGFITNAEAKRRERAEKGVPQEAKPELTNPAQNYVDLHRHAAIRADLLKHEEVALRLIATQMIADIYPWGQGRNDVRAAKQSILESLEANKGYIAFEAERAALAEIVDLPELDDPFARIEVTTVFARLMELDNTMVTRLLVFLSASSLGVSRDLIDVLGLAMGTEMSAHYQVDQTFFDLIRDKQVLNAMVAENAGTTAAKENANDTAKTQRAVLTACMDGTRNPADPNWTPCYMAFPQGSYREEQSGNEVAFDNMQREAA